MYIKQSCNINRCSLLFSIISFLSSLLHAQSPEELKFISYSSQQGLSQNSGYCIAQDKDGFLWMGTQDGLNRFDGKNFRVFYRNTINRGSLGSNLIYSLFCDTVNNRMLIGTDNGVTVYDNTKDSFYSITGLVANAEQLAHASVKNISCFKQGECWITTREHGLFFINTRSKTCKRYFTENKFLKIVKCVAAYRGSILAAAGNSIFQLDNVSGIFEFVKQEDIFRDIKTMLFYNDKLWIGTLETGLYTLDIEGSMALQQVKVPSKKIGNLLQTKDHILWVATRDSGLVSLNKEGQILTHSFSNMLYPNMLPRNFTLSIFSDNQDNIWVGTSGGGFSKLSYEFGFFKTIVSQPLIKNSLPDNMVLSINGNGQQLFIGTQLQGLCVYDANGKMKVYNTHTKGLLNNAIYSIAEISDGLLFVATPSGLLQVNLFQQVCSSLADKNVPESQKGDCILKFKHTDSILYSGNNGAVLYDYKRKQWLPLFNPSTTNFRAMELNFAIEDTGHTVWLCSKNMGFLKYDYQTGVIHAFAEVSKLTRSVRHVAIQGNTLWLASDNGVIIVDKQKEKVVKPIHAANGLSGNVAYAVQAGDNTTLWVSTNKGICVFNKEGNLISYYNQQSGLSGDEFNTACTYKNASGTIYFGGINGITWFSGKPYIRSNYSPLPIITSVNVSDKPLSSALNTTNIKSLAFNHDDNFITFYFAAINFDQPDKTIYQYKMEGVDKNWIESNEGMAKYTSLPPGSFVFKVRSANSQGIWCNGNTAIEIKIHPAWYQTWFFYFFTAVCIILFIYALFRYRVNQLQKMHQMQQRISADLHDDIGASLTSINILSQLSQQQKIDAASRNEYLKKINEQTHEVTNALRDIVWSINPKNDKLELILYRMKRYANELLESKNIDYQFEDNIKAGDEISDAVIRQNLYLIFKEAVNNLAKYSQAKKAIITLRKENAAILLEIKDNGIGFDTAMAAKGNGIENMHRRAQDIHAAFHLISSPAKGTCIKLQIPL